LGHIRGTLIAARVSKILGLKVLLGGGLDRFCTFCTISPMRTITTTEARRNIGTLIDMVRDTGDVVLIGRRNNMEAILMKYPRDYNRELNDITNINTMSQSFDFLSEEADIYSEADLKKKYA